MQYWFYTYEWRDRDGNYTKVNDIFSGTFLELVKFVIKQPEHWVLLNSNEIDLETYEELDGLVG